MKITKPTGESKPDTGISTPSDIFHSSRNDVNNDKVSDLLCSGRKRHLSRSRRAAWRAWLPMLRIIAEEQGYNSLGRRASGKCVHNSPLSSQAKKTKTKKKNVTPLHPLKRFVLRSWLSMADSRWIASVSNGHFEGDVTRHFYCHSQDKDNSVSFGHVTWLCAVIKR